MFFGIDIGSVSVNAVVIKRDGTVLEDHYVRTHGQPIETALNVLEDISSRWALSEVKGVAVTGSGGKLFSELTGAPHVNEVVAQATATGALYPGVRTIIEIGGEDAKLIEIEAKEESGKTEVVDFAMNTVCAAGTGSFLDQQAARLGFTIEEFGEVALKSENPPHIAGRCSVFAKSDMIHLQQEATPDYEIVAGLCYAMARNYRSNIAKGKSFRRLVSFQGGVAANRGMVKAFREVLELSDDELLIPEHFASMGAIGAVLVSLESGEIRGVKPVEQAREQLSSRKTESKRMDSLVADGYEIMCDVNDVARGETTEAGVGVDVGSISTNVVAIDREGNVLARRYLMTAGRPLEAVTQGLYEVGQEIGDRVKVVAVGTTGSGRYLTGDFIGADVVKNEITSHATGAAHFDDEVDTIFEIGGQDSKYVSLDHGAIVDFAMNKVCAAGTGSFLEEQAEKLGIKIEEEFGAIALSAESPVHLGERCTVFMESDLNSHQQRGARKDDLVGGLCYSIVYNYLNRVVEDRRVGERIFFQGGVAYNRGVKAAFEKVLGKKVIVPPHHDVLGAIGVALVSLEENSGKATKFKGFDLRDRGYEIKSFTCTDCPNMCEVRRVDIVGEGALHYGSRCGKYDEQKKVSKGARLPRLFHERERMLLGAYPKDEPDRPNGKTVGMPQISIFFELYPMWKAFFTEMGFKLVLSDATNRRIIDAGLATVAAETCFPIKVAHGHVLNLLEKKVDYIFLPSVVNMPHSSDGIVHSYNCPYVQSVPYIIRAAIELEDTGVIVLEPVIHLERGRKHLERVMGVLAKELGIPSGQAARAIDAAREAQERFYEEMSRRGKEVLDSLSPEEFALVVVSRPYNGCDLRLNLNIPEKLRDLGALAIPMDFLPLESVDVSADYPHMYWKYGERILSAARIIAEDERLHALYITNFGCGPDSFISKFFAKESGGKPYLTIEIDEHTADVGAITRCEAYLDSLRSARKPEQLKKVRAGFFPYVAVKEKGRRILIPHMDDHGHVLAAAIRANGVGAAAMPMADEESLELGRRHTTGKECFPCIITTGDLLKHVMSSEFDRSRDAFFMPSSMGPCRFGQYNKFHRMILDEFGYEDVPIFAFDQSTGFRTDVRNLGTRFRRLAWTGIIFVDTIQKMARQIRPYEKHAGQTDEVYRHYLAEAIRYTEAGSGLRPLARQAMKDFLAVEVRGEDSKPKVGVVGEIFVRCNQFANNFTVKRVEELGGEVVTPTIEEWVNYIGYIRREDLLIDRDIRGYAIDVLTQAVQRREAWRIISPFAPHLRHFPREAPTAEVVKEAEPYIPGTIRGEAVLSMGRAAEYARDGLHGVINLVPFNCLPGTIVDALLEKFRLDHDGIPVLKLAFDGLEQSNEQTRLEAFMHQARQRASRS